MDFPAEISVSNQEPNLTNNTAVDTTAIPGFDLIIGIEGDPEGAFPGNAPNSLQSYTIEYTNE